MFNRCSRGRYSGKFTNVTYKINLFFLYFSPGRLLCCSFLSCLFSSCHHPVIGFPFDTFTVSSFLPFIFPLATCTSLLPCPNVPSSFTTVLFSLWPSCKEWYHMECQRVYDALYQVLISRNISRLVSTARHAKVGCYNWECNNRLLITA